MIIQYFIAPIGEDVWMLGGVKKNGSYLWFEDQIGTQDNMNNIKISMNKELYK